MDVRVEMNNAEILDIEVQIGNEYDWIPRSLLYLCRAYDSLDAGEEYENVKPATQVGILNFDLFPEHPEFYAKYLMTNVKNGNVYTPDFALNVLSLKHIDLATKEDEENGLVYWAKLFKATTWEELRGLSEVSPVFREVTEKMAKSNAELKEKVLLEMHERYLHDYASIKGHLARAEKELRRTKRDLKRMEKEKEQEIEQKEQEIEQKEQEIEQQAQEIEHQALELEKKDMEIVRLQAEIDRLSERK